MKRGFLHRSDIVAKFVKNHHGFAIFFAFIALGFSASAFGLVQLLVILVRFGNIMRGFLFLFLSLNLPSCVYFSWHCRCFIKFCKVNYAMTNEHHIENQSKNFTNFIAQLVPGLDLVIGMKSGFDSRQKLLWIFFNLNLHFLWFIKIFTDFLIFSFLRKYKPKVSMYCFV